MAVKKKSQVEKFREAAREAGTDESEEHFNATLKDLAKAKRDPKEGEKTTNPTNNRPMEPVWIVAVQF
jgi:hypothetical protein